MTELGACSRRTSPWSCPALPSRAGASKVKHVSAALDEAKEQEMSHMNTCQVMSSPVSADDGPQLLVRSTCLKAFQLRTTAERNQPCAHRAFIALW